MQAVRFAAVALQPVVNFLKDCRKLLRQPSCTESCVCLLTAYSSNSAVFVAADAAQFDMQTREIVACNVIELGGHMQRPHMRRHQHM